MASERVKLTKDHDGTKYYACAVGVGWGMLDLAIKLQDVYANDVVVDCAEIVEKASVENWDDSEYPELVEMCKQALKQDISVLLLYA